MRNRTTLLRAEQSDACNGDLESERRMEEICIV